jgi:hypothetical protein
MPLPEVLLSKILKAASVFFPTEEKPKKVKVALEERPETDFSLMLPSKKISNERFTSSALTVTLLPLSTKAEAGEAAKSEYSPRADKTDNPRTRREEGLDIEV